MSPALALLDERACRRHNEHPYLGRHADPARRSTRYDRHRAPQPLFTSGKTDDGCLTHIARFVTEFVDRDHLSVEGLCGTSQCLPRWVAPADETFLCRRCHARAETHGLDTFGLIPDSGCAISGGKRGLRALVRRTA